MLHKNKVYIHIFYYCASYNIDIDRITNDLEEKDLVRRFSNAKYNLVSCIWLCCILKEIKIQQIHVLSFNSLMVK